MTAQLRPTPERSAVLAKATLSAAEQLGLLDPLVGGDEGKRKAWMSSYNKALVGQPNQLIRKADGLVRTLAYLDGMRAAS